MTNEERARVAELLEEARDIDHADPVARLRWMQEAMASQRWVKGKMHRPLAELWDLHEGTVKTDSTTAWRMVKAAENGTELGKFAVRTAQAIIEDRVALSGALAGRVREEVAVKAKPSAIRDVTSALTSVDSMALRTIEWLGKVGGLGTDTPSVSVTIGGETARVKTEVLTAMPSELLNMLAEVVTEHPEHAPVLALLDEKIRAKFNLDAKAEPPLLDE